MAELVTIARPYAQAIFRLAQESKTQSLWSERFTRLLMVVQNTEMAAIIVNPGFSANQVTGLLLSLSGEQDSRELKGFISLLAENRRFAALPQIQAMYEQLKHADEGSKVIEVICAYPLDEAHLNNLLPQLETHFGSKLLPRVTVDGTLIGGIRIIVGDQVLDASVRGKLDAMAAALKN